MPFYFAINDVNGYFEENNGKKYFNIDNTYKYPAKIYAFME